MEKKIRLLILCQKVDSNNDLLGFFHDWITEFAKKCEQLTVVCLYKGDYDLPANVKIISLGKDTILKEQYNSRIVKSLYFFRFFKYIWMERNNYDTVFVHMNPEYIVIGGWLWKLCGKKITLWYAHKSISWKLKLAEKMSDIIFTASSESFRLPSGKVKVVGHGIDTNKFTLSQAELENNKDELKIITIGRISRIKDYETLIRAMEMVGIGNPEQKFIVNVIGAAPYPEDEEYLESLISMVHEKRLDGVFSFLGSLPNHSITQYLQSADIFVSTSLTGSLDKAILEAMACGLPVLTCNDAAVGMIGSYNNKLIFNSSDYKALAECIKYISDLDIEQRKKISFDLRNDVIKNHSLPELINKIIIHF